MKLMNAIMACNPKMEIKQKTDSLLPLGAYKRPDGQTLLVFYLKYLPDVVVVVVPNAHGQIADAYIAGM